MLHNQPDDKFKYLLFILIIVVSVFAVLEISARLVVSNPGDLVYGKHRQIINVLGLPSLNSIMVFDDHLFWVLKSPLDKKRVSGKIRETPLDFRVTVQNRLRVDSIPRKTAGMKILALGDSCTFGLGVDNNDTWPAQLQVLCNEKRVDAAVTNAGVPGYSAFQGRRWFQSEGLRLKPDVVIASFGFNDREAWSALSDREIARRLGSRKRERILLKSRFYLVLKLLIRNVLNRPQEVQSESLDERSPIVGRVDQIGMRPRLTVDEFTGQLTDLITICRNREIELYFLIWPYRQQIELPLDQLIYYQVILNRVGEEHGIHVINLVTPFIMTGDDLFVDHVHANEKGNKLAASIVFQSLPGNQQTHLVE